MTKEQINENGTFVEKRKDVILIDPRNLEIKDGFNVRVDMGNIDELTDSIVENGVREPLRGYRSKDKKNVVIVTDGHRRTTAVKLAIERGVDIARVPIILEPKGYKEEDRILDMILCNDGKRLTMFEEGQVYKRLINLGYQQNEVSKKAGRSVAHVSNALCLANASKRVQNQIATGKISDNTVLEIIKATDDEETQLQMIAGAVADVQLTGKTKATAKNVKGLKTKSPIKVLKEVVEICQSSEIKNEKTELLEIILNEIKAKKSVEEIVELLK